MIKEQELLESALQSKFYREKLLKRDYSNFADVPITSKQELRECDAYDVMGTTFDNIATYHETSGTSGKPTPSWYSFADVKQEAKVIIDSQLSLNSKDLLLNRFPFALAIPSFILYWACQEVGAGHIAVDKASAVTPHARVTEILERTRPTIVAMLPSEAEIIAEACKRRGVQLPTPNLRALFLAGELISDKRKQHFEKLWGVPVFGFFGSTESGGLYVTCEHGHYHVGHPKVKIEVVDKDLNPLGYGKRGYCVVSSAREGMPLLRYFNNDVIELREPSSCPCGSEFPVLLHYGREDDIVNINGKEISFLDIQDAVYTLPQVPFLWKVHVSSDSLTFEYQMSETVDRNVNCSLAIKQHISEKLGIRILAKENELISNESLVTKPNYAKFSYLIQDK